jgi:hypothetical protein
MRHLTEHIEYGTSICRRCGAKGIGLQYTNCPGFLWRHPGVALMLLTPVLLAAGGWVIL